jgi:hypothetical protein
VVLEAIVNGVVKTERIWIRVLGGDTIPNPPVDTLPTDTIPTDTLPPGGGGGGGGCSEGVPSGLSGGLAACEPEEDSIVIDVAISRPTVLPVIAFGNFNAITQVAVRRGVAHDRHDTVTVTVTAMGVSDGAPKAGAQVILRATPVFPSGGHIHEIAPRPTGTFLRQGDSPKDPTAGSRGQITLTTDSTGTATIRYRSSGIGGIERIVASSPSAPAGARTDSTALTVRYPGLVAMVRDGGAIYQYKEQDPNPAFPSQRHGNNNHWVRPAFRDSVLAVFADFYRRGGQFIGPTTKSFVITDAGLEYGGLLESGDSDAFEWRDPHLTHRTGNDMDIRSKEGGQYVFTWLSYERLIASCFPRTHLDGGDRVRRCDLEPPPNTNPPHLHIEGL